MYLLEQTRYCTGDILRIERSIAEMAMNGRITKFDLETGIGIISTEDGVKFRFHRLDVLNAEGSLLEEPVDFVVRMRVAKDIVIVSGSAWTAFGGEPARITTYQAGV